jgi:hypothetical protein
MELPVANMGSVMINVVDKIQALVNAGEYPEKLF